MDKNQKKENVDKTLVKDGQPQPVSNGMDKESNENQKIEEKVEKTKESTQNTFQADNTKNGSKQTQENSRVMKKNFRRSSKRGDRRERLKPEFEQKILNIRRVARVVAGGRRFSFSVAMVAGDGKGKVGVGLGKSSDTSVAIAKAFNDAKKNMIKVKVTKKMSIPHEVFAKYCASRVMIIPTPGRGRVAGSSVRDVLELSGIRDVSAKILSRSKNNLNNAKATIKALSSISTK